ncbi:MAG TPA: HAMP domain-containing protein [Bryobacteraceae bacterium]|nr:HAMP domain-containing protein [Bryobacteraceae bacterium]
MVRFRSYRTRLLSAFLLLGLGALAVTGWEASEGATAALRAATWDRLTAIRETRGRQLERYFQDLGNHVIALSSDESTITALEHFAASLSSLRPVADASSLKQQYQELFRQTGAREPRRAEEIRGWFPRDATALALQDLWIARSKYPHGSRFYQLHAPEGGAYSSVHARFHPTLHRYLSAFGFYDIFLISAPESRVLYTTMKEVDLGVLLSREPYRRSGLASAYRRALALTEPESFVVEDYEPYLPSNAAPAAFVAAPIYRAGLKIGVLAIQLSIRDINDIMTGGGRWAEEGLGRSGQAYVVATDGTLRSDLRREVENPQVFLAEIRSAGAPAQAVERIGRYGTAVLNLKVAQDTAAEDTRLATDFRGMRVLRSQAPLDLPDLEWTVIADIEAAEALAPVRQMQWRIFWQSVLVAGLLAAAAHLLAGRVTRPLVQLAAGARRLGARDFGVRLGVSGDAELAELAESFNRMAADLETTTVSKQELDRILASLMNAVLVLEGETNVSVDQILRSRVQTVNPAGMELLRVGERELCLQDLLPPEDLPAWHTRISRLLETGLMRAEQAALLRSDGVRIPVLVSASTLAQEHGRKPGLVWVAQDVTAWKAAQEGLHLKQAELETLTSKLLTAQEEERRRLARELHDDFTQRLAAIAIEAGNLERMAPSGEGPVRPALARIRRQMADLSHQVHDLSRSLHPSTLDDLGLVAAIESECRAFFERGGPPVDFNVSGELPHIKTEAQLGLYRIVEEALRNVLKHAHADEVAIDLQSNSEQVHLTIHDNGLGFDPAARTGRGGIGVTSMAERARLIGAALEIRSAPGQGTTIDLLLLL